MDLGISNTRDKSLESKNTRGGCVLLDKCQQLYLKCPPFSAKAILNASSRKLLRITLPVIPEAGGLGQHRAAGEKGGEGTGPWASVSLHFPSYCGAGQDHS